MDPTSHTGAALSKLSQGSDSLDPIDELNNYLQDHRLGILTQHLSFRSKRLLGPIHEGIYTYRNNVVGTGRGTSVGGARSAAAAQALQYFRTSGIRE